MKGPPVVEGKVAQTQKGNQEPSGPLGLETDNNHDASDEGDDWHNGSGNAELSIEDERDEKEDEENASSELYRC